MFAKVFKQIFSSSIANNHVHRHVFMDLLVLADSEGCVDMTMEAIARMTNVPLEQVTEAITTLSQPDPESNTPSEEGRRLVLSKDGRPWGWRIVNYHIYRAIRDEEARRENNRTYKQAERERKAKRKKPGKVRFCPHGPSNLKAPPNHPDDYPEERLGRSHSLYCKCDECMPDNRTGAPVTYE